MSASSAVPEYRLLTDIAVSRLRELILGGSLQPGQRINQDRLAKEFGISRNPVREALSRLSAEGLVVLRPNVGAVIAALDFQELREIYQIREVLEALAIELACPQLTPEHLDRLASLVREMEELPASETLRLWLDLDRRFHLDTYRPCGSARLFELIDRHWNMTQQYRRAYLTHGDGRAIAEHAHRLIIGALSEHNVELAKERVVQHLRTTVRTVATSDGLSYGDEGLVDRREDVPMHVPS